VAEFWNPTGIPLAAARVTQHDLHEVACDCGRVHRAAAPAGTGAAGTVTYGLNLQAWCVRSVLTLKNTQVSDRHSVLAAPPFRHPSVMVNTAPFFHRVCQTVQAGRV
jgi:hypothetical protein